MRYPSHFDSFLDQLYAEWLTGKGREPSRLLATTANLGPAHHVAGLTAGQTIRAIDATSAAFAQLQHSDLGGVTADLHHAQSHVLTGADHTETGLTTNHVLCATGATTFAFQAFPAAGLPAHASYHQDTGGDEISVQGLSGLLADAQTPLAHKTSHQDTGSDEISVQGLSGLLADAQTPLSHAIASAGGYHSASGLTIGHVLTATAADAFAFQALPATSTPIAHDLLSAYHGDTLAGAVAAGSLVYGNATPKWAALAHPGAAGQVLNTNAATTFAWTASPTLTGLTLSGLTLGSVLFAGTSGVISQDNTGLFFNSGNDYLGIGTASPANPLDVRAVGAQISETGLTYSSFQFGVIGGTGRIQITHSSGTNWQIDNTGPDVRFYRPGVVYFAMDVTGIGIKAANKLYFDGTGMDGNTWMRETSADLLEAYVGNVKMLSMSATVAYLNHLQITDNGSVVTLGRA